MPYLYVLLQVFIQDQYVTTVKTFQMALLVLVPGAGVWETMASRQGPETVPCASNPPEMLQRPLTHPRIQCQTWPSGWKKCAVGPYYRPSSNVHRVGEAHKA